MNIAALKASAQPFLIYSCNSKLKDRHDCRINNIYSWQGAVLMMMVLESHDKV